MRKETFGQLPLRAIVPYNSSLNGWVFLLLAKQKQVRALVVVQLIPYSVKFTVMKYPTRVRLGLPLPYSVLDIVIPLGFLAPGGNKLFLSREWREYHITTRYSRIDIFSFLPLAIEEALRGFSNEPL